MRKDCIHLRGGVQALQTTPERLGAGEVIAFSSKMPPDGPYHKHRFAQGRGLFGSNRSLVYIATKRLPLDVLEKNRTGQLRRLSPEHGQMIDPPSYHHVNTKTCFKALRRAKLTVLDTATTLERPVIDLDPPCLLYTSDAADE